MKKIVSIYPDAIERTKGKIHEDITYFLQTKEALPSFEDYIEKRKQYLEQIWFNVWMNLATGQVPREEKKQYLRSKGFDVEGVNKKTINKLFRHEIKAYKPFLVEEWLHDTYALRKEQWLQLYQESREALRKQLEEQALELEVQKAAAALIEEVSSLISAYRPTLYLRIRKIVADAMKKDFETKTKYQTVEPDEIEERLVPQGFFLHEDYDNVEEFFSEITGQIQKVFVWNRFQYEYETYFDLYEALIHEKVYEILFEYMKESLSPAFKQNYDGSVVDAALDDLITDEHEGVSTEMMSAICDEDVSDLIKLAEIPYDEELHRSIFMKDMLLREKRREEERAEIERKKAEEARMLDDIFGREYNPPSGRDVRYILHIGETNTGKTYRALQRMMSAETGIYLAPLRLLALEVFDYLNEHGTPCSLKTGEEEKINTHARHLSCTVEMFHEKEFYEVVVIDEAQMIADKDRGFSWYKAITKVRAEEVHIIASFNAKSMLVQLLGDSDIEINEYQRDIPLQVEKKEFKLKQVKKGDALICFSRKRVLETASRLQNNGHTVSMIYGSMPPETRKKQVERFIKGEAKVIVATDAIGMGLNLPIQRVVFLENQKFDGTSRRLLTSQEIKQIAGRAGRKGIYEVGKVAFTENVEMMKKRLLKDDEPLQTFTIAPTNNIFERFQKYYRDLGTFFDLWEKFKSPKGTRKAALTEEKELYELIRDSEMEARLSLMDLYGLLHLPFSTREPDLIRQWKKTVQSIVEKKELPEPKIKSRTLEDLELSYKSIGLHLLFLYRSNERTEAVYWERYREKISDLVHEKLKTEVKNIKKRCRKCNKILPWDHRYPICDSCYEQKYINYYDHY